MALPSRNVCLYGTEEEPAAARSLTAGPVTVEFENGALRHIKYGGIEVLRGIAFLVRNVNWGTYSPRISDLQVEERGGGFRVTYLAGCADERQSFSYKATLTGTSAGSLAFDVEGAPETNFETNRLGFVVLHPLVGVAGEGLTVTHTDGSTEETTFPYHISPSQPVFDIRALAHEVRPGVTATCTFSTVPNLHQDIQKHPARLSCGPPKCLRAKGKLMVHPGGFEPPTFGSVVRCSIQLSYGRFGDPGTGSQEPRAKQGR